MQGTVKQAVGRLWQVLLRRQRDVMLRDNTEDFRSQIVKMTEQGAQILRQVAANTAPFFAALFSGSLKS